LIKNYFRYHQIAEFTGVHTVLKGIIFSASYEKICTYRATLKSVKKSAIANRQSQIHKSPDTLYGYREPDF